MVELRADTRRERMRQKGFEERQMMIERGLREMMIESTSTAKIGNVEASVTIPNPSSA